MRFEDVKVACEKGHPEPELGCISCFELALKRAAELEFDAMTGLLRREVGLERAARLSRRKVCAVVYVDLDALKQHNTIARSRGDWAIMIASAAVAGQCRASDIGIRLGGDELVLVAPVCDVGSPRRKYRAHDVADKLAHRLEAIVQKESSGAVSISTATMAFTGTHSELLVALDRLSAEAEKKKAKRRGESTQPAAGIASTAAVALNLSVEAARFYAGQTGAADRQALLARMDVLVTSARLIASGDPEALAVAASTACELAAICAQLADSNHGLGAGK